MIKTKNAEIILHKSMELMKQGVLQGTHAYFHYKDEDGNKIYTQIPEYIYSEAEVKSHGWSIKKGVTPLPELKFPIWVKVGNKFIKEQTQFYRDSELNKS